MSEGASSRRSSISQIEPTPFMLRLFYRTGSFTRLEDYASSSLPPHVQTYVGSGCTLYDLALELAASDPNALPIPAIGTRLVFQLVCPDLRNTSMSAYSQPRFAVKDIGSVVIGAGGPGAEDTEENPLSERDGEKTLEDIKFVVGDYISCAVLPPLQDGSVATASAVRLDSGFKVRDGRGGHRGGFPPRNGGFGRGGAHRSDRSSGDAIPKGEWKRGERLPDNRPRGRGRGRW